MIDHSFHGDYCFKIVVVDQGQIAVFVDFLLGDSMRGQVIKITIEVMHEALGNCRGFFAQVWQLSAAEFLGLSELPPV